VCGGEEIKRRLKSLNFEAKNKFFNLKQLFYIKEVKDG
jgi:hypothetical protein